MAAENVVYAPMTPSMAGALASLDRLCFSEPWSEKSFAHMASDERYVALVAVEKTKKEILGYAGLLAVPDEGDVTNIGVLPAFRRQGIGRGLLTRLIADAETRGIRFIHLEVRVTNASAIGLYESLGFVRDGKRPRFYRNPVEDALLMTLILPK